MNIQQTQHHSVTDKPDLSRVDEEGYCTNEEDLDDSVAPAMFAQARRRRIDFRQLHKIKQGRTHSDRKRKDSGDHTSTTPIESITKRAAESTREKKLNVFRLPTNSVLSIGKEKIEEHKGEIMRNLFM